MQKGETESRDRAEVKRDERENEKLMIESSSKITSNEPGEGNGLKYKKKISDVRADNSEMS